MQTPPNCNVCFLPAARPDSCFLNEYRGCFKILQVFGSAKGANDLPLIKVKGCTPNRKGCETGKTRHLNNCLESIRIEEKGLRTDFHPSASHFRKRRHVRVKRRRIWTYRQAPRPASSKETLFEHCAHTGRSPAKTYLPRRNRC